PYAPESDMQPSPIADAAMPDEPSERCGMPLGIGGIPRDWTNYLGFAVARAYSGGGKIRRYRLHWNCPAPRGRCDGRVTTLRATTLSAFSFSSATRTVG